MAEDKNIKVVSDKTQVKVGKFYMAKNKQSYAELLQHPKWQKKRLEILQRDQFRCVQCNDDDTTLRDELHKQLKERI